MTWLSDTTSLVAPNWLSSDYRGHGVRGGDVPADGSHGGSPVRDDLAFPTDIDIELRWDIVLAPIDGTLQVFEDLTYIWTPPPGTVNAARTLRYTLKGYSDPLYTDNEVILLGTGDYTQVSSDRSLSWSTRVAAQSDATLTWALRNAVQADRSLSWAITSTGQVVSDQSLAWALRSGVQTDRALSWTLRSPVQRDASIAWSVLNAGQVISDQSLTWVLRSAVQRDSLQSWLAYQSVIANRDLAWAISTVESVTSDAMLAWTMRASVTRDRSLSWMVGASAVPPVIRLKVTFTKIPTFVTRSVR